MDINQDISNAFEFIKAEEIILYPTDTLRGIGCEVTNQEAIVKI